MQHIGRFTITQTGNIFTVSYTRSLKDWSDMVIVLAIGLGCTAFAIFITTILFQKFNWVLLLPIAAFGFVAVLRLSDGVARLLQKTGDVITIKTDEGILIANYFWGKSRSFPFETIKCLKLNGRVDNVKWGRYKMRRVYCKMEVDTKDDKTESLLHINPTQLVRISDKKIEADTYAIASKLAKFIAEKTGAKYQWTGFHEDDVS